MKQVRFLFTLLLASQVFTVANCNIELMVSLADFNTIEDALLPWLSEQLMINKTFDVQIRAANPILIAPTYVHSIRIDNMYFDHETSGISLYEGWDYGMRYTMRNLRVELTLDIRTHWLWLFT